MNQPRLPSHRVLGAALSALLSMGLTACDPQAAEREAALAEHARLQMSLQQEQLAAEKLSGELANIERQLVEQQATLAALQSEKAARSAQLTRFMAEHKAASVALAATGAGAITALDAEARQSLQAQFGEGAGDVALVAGLVGSGYCLFNAEECSTVAAHWVAHGEERKANDEQAVQVRALMQGLETARDTQRQDFAARQAAVQLNQAKLLQIDARVKALRCQGLFCP